MTRYGEVIGGRPAGAFDGDGGPLESLLFWTELLWNLQTPEEKAEMLKKQKKCWVYGQTKLSNPNITREMVDKIVDKQYEKEKTE